MKHAEVNAPFSWEQARHVPSDFVPGPEPQFEDLPVLEVESVDFFGASIQHKQWRIVRKETDPIRP